MVTPSVVNVPLVPHSFLHGSTLARACSLLYYFHSYSVTVLALII